MHTEPIHSFTSGYRFLSNFFSSPVSYDGWMYPTVEHAYQAAKTDDQMMREVIRKCKTPSGAKHIGRHVRLKFEWDKVKVQEMRVLLRQKFLTHKDLRGRLLSTWPAELIEGNWWHGNFWGVCGCVDCEGKSGLNTLGKLLMEIREEFRNEQQESTTQTTVPSEEEVCDKGTCVGSTESSNTER